MAKEYIEIENAVNIASSYYGLNHNQARGFRADLKRASAANVRENVRGEWIPVDELNDAFDCSVCDVMVSKRLNYCPNCGAEMRGGNDG